MKSKCKHTSVSLTSRCDLNPNFHGIPDIDCVCRGQLDAVRADALELDSRFIRYAGKGKKNKNKGKIRL